MMFAAPLLTAVMCVAPPPPCKALKQSTHVFIGDVEAVGPNGSVTFRLVETLLGIQPGQEKFTFKNQSLSSESNGFGPQQRWIVYGQLLPDGTFVTSCTLSRVLEPLKGTTPLEILQLRRCAPRLSAFSDVEETQIIEAALHHPQTLRHFGPRRVDVIRNTALPEAHLAINATGLSIRDYESGQRVEVAAEVVRSAKERNRRARSTKKIRRAAPAQIKFDPQVGYWERITISRPGLSADGLRAVVFVSEDIGYGGLAIYLEKRNGVWVAVGEGGQWEA